MKESVEVLIKWINLHILISLSFCDKILGETVPQDQYISMLEIQLLQEAQNMDQVVQQNQAIMAQLQWMNSEPFHHRERGKKLEDHEIKDN
jgi:hypothetical protein